VLVLGVAATPPAAGGTSPTLSTRVVRHGDGWYY
jgi:hypothetical protein